MNEAISFAKFVMPFLAVCIQAQFTTVRACEYTVRDIGFIDLDGPDYELLLVVPHEDQIVPLCGTKDYDASFSHLFHEWNITPRVLSRDKDEALLPPSLSTPQQKPDNTLEVWLVDRERRAILLSEFDLQNSLDHIEVARSALEKLQPQELQSLSKRAFDSFAHVLWFEGNNGIRENAELEKANAGLQKIAGLLPRSIDLPIRTVKIPTSKRAQFRWLLWSLGAEDVASESAVVAVLYGRGKLASAPLLGSDVQAEELLAQFALIGESCECETERSWHQERVLPFQWDDELEDDAIHFLGFNPASQLVKSEVGRILERGPNSGLGTAATGDRIDDLVHVYREAKLLPVPPGHRKNNDDSVATPAINATVVQGVGWGFDASTQPSDSVSNDRAKPTIAEPLNTTAQKGNVASLAAESHRSVDRNARPNDNDEQGTTSRIQLAMLGLILAFISTVFIFMVRK